MADVVVTTTPVSSQLERLKAKRDSAREETLDLEVPGYDGLVFVRYRRLDQAALDAEQAKAAKFSRDKPPPPGWSVRSNATLLAKACVGIFSRDDDGTVKGLGDPDDPPKFDGLAAFFDEQHSNNLDAVKSLYVADGDVTAAARKLTIWSGFTAEAAEVARPE